MPTRKIKDLPKRQTCNHPEHRPPSMMVFKPGVYEHTCPACGHRIIFTIGPYASMQTSPECAARLLSALGASKGGKKRAESLTPERRREIAVGAANKRWKS